jgi:large subunit ribosomal protein L7Ae
MEVKMDLNKELPKEVVEKAYQAVEAAKKTGKIKKGTNEVTKEIERGNAKLVLVAKDTNPKEVIMHLPVLCEEKGIPCAVVNSREELGTAAGLTVSTSAVAITKEGDAAKLIKELAPQLEDGNKE